MGEALLFAHYCSLASIPGDKGTDRAEYGGTERPSGTRQPDPPRESEIRGTDGQHDPGDRVTEAPDTSNSIDLGEAARAGALSQARMIYRAIFASAVGRRR